MSESIGPAVENELVPSDVGSETSATVLVTAGEQSASVRFAASISLGVTAPSDSSDSRLAKEVCAQHGVDLALKLERRLRCLMQLEVRVHVWEDHVQIFGTVSSWYAKQKAQEVAREIAPEYRIRNELRVSAS